MRAGSNGPNIERRTKLPETLLFPCSKLLLTSTVLLQQPLEPLGLMGVREHTVSDTNDDSKVVLYGILVLR